MKKVIALFISCLPFNILRIFFYKLIFNYKIAYKAKIGFLSIIVCKKCEIKQYAKIGLFNRIQCAEFYCDEFSTIRRYNSIRGIFSFSLGKYAVIGARNSFTGDMENIYKDVSAFRLGENSSISIRHVFDVVDKITIGNNVVFGGWGTSLWTHGYDIYRTRMQSPIIIGNNIYIGSNSIINPGIYIANNSIIGSGTVVSHSINESGFYVSNSLIKKSDIQNYKEQGNAITINGKFYLRKNIFDGANKNG